MKRTRPPLRLTSSSPSGTGSTVSGRTRNGTEASVSPAPGATASRRPKTVPGLVRRTMTGVGWPGSSVPRCGATIAPSDGISWTWVEAAALSSSWIGSSAPLTAVGGSEMTPGLASGAFSRPAPVRSGGRPAGTAAPISAARSWAGERSGRVRASLIATAAAEAAAIALPPATAAPPPARGRDLAGGRGRGRAWAGRPRTGPGALLGEGRSFSSTSGCSVRSRRPEAHLGAGLGLEHLLRGVAGDADHGHRRAAGGDRGQRPVVSGVGEQDGPRAHGGRGGRPARPGWRRP